MGYTIVDFGKGTGGTPPPVQAQPRADDTVRKQRFKIVAMPDQVMAGTGEPQQPNIGQKGDIGTGPVRPSATAAFNQGTTFGAADEIVSGIAAPIMAAVNEVRGKGPRGISENYQQAKAQQDAQLAATREQNPIASTALEILGGLTSGGVGAKFIAKAPSIAGKAIRSGTVGGGVGGVYGFAGTDGDIADRAAGGATGAATGAILGTALPPVFAMSRAIMRATTAPIRSLARPERFAAQKAAEALARDNLTPQRVTQRLQSNSAIKGDLSLADVAGENTRALLDVAATVPSQARRGLLQSLENRQQSQLKRLTDDIAGAFGDPRRFVETTDQLVGRRKQVADRMFPVAFDTPTPYTIELERVLERPIAKQLVQRAAAAAANRGEQFRNIFIQINPNGTATAKRVIDTEGLHRVKMIVDEMISGMKRGEPTGLDNVNARDLSIFKNDLLAAIQNQPYKDALRQYAGDSALVNALDEGAEEGLKMEPEMIRKALASLSPGEADLWRLGFARSVVNRLRDAGRTGTNRADILASPKFMERIAAAIPSGSKRREFMQAIRLEQRMAQTRNAVTGNSKTYQRMVQGQEAGAEAESAATALQIGRQVATGGFTEAAISFLGRAKNTATGLRPEVADQLIRMLTSRDPQNIRRAQALIAQQTSAIARRQGRTEVLDGLRAISAGISGGQMGQALASP